MKYIWKFIWKFTLLALCCAFPALAQEGGANGTPFTLPGDGITSGVASEQTTRCSTHTRDWRHPLSSNICPDDYQAWLKTREHDRWFKDKWFWTGTAVIGASVAADAWTTSAALGRGAVEQNPLLGPRPSNGRIAAWSAGGFAAYVGLNYLSYKLSHNDPSKAWRSFGRWSVPAIVAGIHGPLAIHNSHTCEKGCP